MQEEVNEKTIALGIRGGKITAEILKAALFKLLQDMEKSRERASRKKDLRIKGKAANDNGIVKRGKQSLSEMMKHGSELTNIEITDQNIRSFERVARRYSIDYSLKKDKSVDPPRYLVFFRAKDIDVMKAAFKEYTGVALQRSSTVSIRKRLQKAIARSAKHREREKTRQRDRGQEL